MLAEDVFQETGWIFSHNLAHKCCKDAGIRSKARKYRYKKKDGEEHVKFANEVKGNWNAAGPIQIVVSDMTVFKNKGKNWEWTLLVDTFNNEILAHQATPIQGILPVRCSTHAHSRIPKTSVQLPSGQYLLANG